MKQPVYFIFYKNVKTSKRWTTPRNFNRFYTMKCFAVSVRWIMYFSGTYKSSWGSGKNPATIVSLHVYDSATIWYRHIISSVVKQRQLAGECYWRKRFIFLSIVGNRSLKELGINKAYNKFGSLHITGTKPFVKHCITSLFFEDVIF